MNNILLLIQITFMYAAPLIFAALGGVISERSGVVNLALEGMMTIGAFVGAAVGYATGSPWLGLLAGGLAGAAVALPHAVASVTLKADQTISGIALNFIAPGLSIFLCRLLFNNSTSTNPSKQLPKILSLFGVNTEGNVALQTLNVNVTILMAGAAAVLMWFILYRTKWGLRVVAVGEHPAAADTLGVNVSLTRYVCVLLSGLLAGFGGVAASLAVVSAFTMTTISGQGFIALAAVIFGKWKPQGALGACLLFGFAQALVVVLGGGKAVVPSQVLSMLPYILTLVVLVLFIGKSAAPKADGVPYIKGAR